MTWRMTPYYNEDGITIYHGDCAYVLPMVSPDSVSLVLTDPPYGIGWDATSLAFDPASGTHGATKREMPAVHGDDQPFDPRPLTDRYRRLVLFGANHYLTRLPDGGGLIVWDKTGDKVAPGARSEAEVAWTNVTTTVRLYKQLWLGGIRDFGAVDRKLRVHPTQKPVALMKWILERWTEPGDLIFDPYMGSGPIAQACHESGRRYIGVEIVEDYCRVAVDRLAQGVLAL